MSEKSTKPDVVELARRGAEAFNRGDIDGILALYTADAIWDMSPVGMGVFEGRDAIRALYEDWSNSYEDFEQVIEELCDLGNDVGLGVYFQRGRPAGSSGFVELRYGSVGILREGLIERVTNYTDIHQARAAAERLAEERGWAASQENVEAVRQGFQALHVGGVEALLPFFATDVVMHPFPEWPDDPVYRGYDGARKLIGSWTDNFEDWGIDVREIRAAGTRVVALTEMTGQIKGSGVPIRQPMGAAFSDFHENTAREVHFFLTWREALEAVGLER